MCDIRGRSGRQAGLDGNTERFFSKGRDRRMSFRWFGADGIIGKPLHSFSECNGFFPCKSDVVDGFNPSAYVPVFHLWQDRTMRQEQVPRENEFE